jgi:hypothetical protein
LKFPANTASRSSGLFSRTQKVDRHVSASPRAKTFILHKFAVFCRSVQLYVRIISYEKFLLHHGKVKLSKFDPERLRWAQTPGFRPARACLPLAIVLPEADAERPNMAKVFKHVQTSNIFKLAVISPISRHLVVEIC